MAWDQEYFFKLSLSAHEAEYARLLDRFKGLDSKAQGAAVSCGVFLTAAFAMAREPGGNKRAAVMLGAVAIFLALALGLALWAMYVQVFEDAPSGHGVRRMREDLVAGREALPPAPCAGFHRELEARWEEALGSLKKANETKSQRLQSAQALLGITAVLATLGIGFVLFT